MSDISQMLRALTRLMTVDLTLSRVCCVVIEVEFQCKCTAFWNLGSHLFKVRLLAVLQKLKKIPNDSEPVESRVTFIDGA